MIDTNSPDDTEKDTSSTATMSPSGVGIA